MNDHVWCVTKKTTNECMDDIYHCQKIQKLLIFFIKNKYIIEKKVWNWNSKK
jgi:hypothetical protein